MTRTSVGSDSGSTAKPWFCDVISIFPVSQLLHRMVRAAMAELQLVGLAAERQRRAAGARGRCRRRAHPTSRASFAFCDGVAERRRIAGAVAEEHAVRIRSPAARDAGAVAGNTRTSQPYAVKRRRMFHFMPKSYAAIFSGRSARRSGTGVNSPDGLSDGCQSNGASHVTPTHEIRALHRREIARAVRPAHADRRRRSR